MRTLTLKGFEDWFKTKDRIQKSIEYGEKKLLDKEENSEFINKTITRLKKLLNGTASKKARVLYTINYAGNLPKYELVCYSIVGNYDDVVLTIKYDNEDEEPKF